MPWPLYMEYCWMGYFAANAAAIPVTNAATNPAANQRSRDGTLFVASTLALSAVT